MVRRLKRDNPKLAGEVIAGNITANEVAIQAGFRKKKIQVEPTIDGFSPINGGATLMARIRTIKLDISLCNYNWKILLLNPVNFRGDYQCHRKIIGVSSMPIFSGLVL